MSFFNLFFKNLLGYKIEKSDIIRDNSVKEIKFNSIEKYKNDKLVNKLNMDNRDYLFIDYQSLDDQLQKITNELNDLKLNGKIGGVKNSGKNNKIKEIVKKIDSLITETPQQNESTTTQQSNSATPYILIAYGLNPDIYMFIEENFFKNRYKDLYMNYD